MSSVTSAFSSTISPLWELPNAILTSHASSISAGAPDRRAEHFFANLTRFLRGEPLSNLAGGA